MTGGISVAAVCAFTVCAFISPGSRTLCPCGSGPDLATRQRGRHAEDRAVHGAPVSPDLRQGAEAIQAGEEVLDDDAHRGERAVWARLFRRSLPARRLFHRYVQGGSWKARLRSDASLVRSHGLARAQALDHSPPFEQRQVAGRAAPALAHRLPAPVQRDGGLSLGRGRLLLA